MSDPNQDFHAPPPPAIESEPERRRPAYLLWIGIALFVAGIIVAVLGIPVVVNVLVGGITTGIYLCGLGILFAAFSFIPLPAVKDAPPPMSTAGTLTGIFFEPSDVFTNLRAHPRWLAAALIIGLVNAGYVAAFTHRLTPERIVNYAVDKMGDISFIPKEAIEQGRTQGVQQAKAVTFQIGAFVQKVVGAFFMAALLAALFLIGVMAFGGRMHFWQALAVATYASLPVTIIQKAISFIVLYLKSPDDIHPLIGQESLVYDNLGYLVSGKDHPVLWAVATAIGVLSFYKLWLWSRGLYRGGTKVTSSTGWAVAITFWVLALLLGVVLATLFGSFLG